MLSFETRVNGKLINYMHVINTGCKERDTDIYNIRYFRPEANPPVIEFKIKHKREKGAESLIAKIYSKISKEL